MTTSRVYAAPLPALAAHLPSPITSGEQLDGRGTADMGIGVPFELVRTRTEKVNAAVSASNRRQGASSAAPSRRPRVHS